MGRFWKEVGQMLDHKIAQGAAELAQGLNAQADAYVPYGAGQKPLEVEGPTMSYQEMLRESAQRVEPESLDKGIDR